MKMLSEFSFFLLFGVASRYVVLKQKLLLLIVLQAKRLVFTPT